MKYLIISLFIWTSLYANLKEELFSLYQNQEYKKACKLGFEKFLRFKKNEELVSLYGFVCLKSDYIDRLSIPMTALRSTKEARANASYFSVILMQKKMLYHALIDDYDISGLKLPTTEYILSKVFDLYVQQNDHNKRFYNFQDPDDPKKSYKLYIRQDKDTKKMVIEEFYDRMFVKQHIYW